MTCLCTFARRFVSFVWIAAIFGSVPSRAGEPSSCALEDALLSSPTSSSQSVSPATRDAANSAVQSFGCDRSMTQNLSPLFELEKGTLLRLAMDDPVKVSNLHPGDVVEGKLTRAVFHQEREIVPSGTRLRLVVDRVKRKRLPHSSVIRHVAKLFVRPSESNQEFEIIPSSASLSLPSGAQVPLEVSFVSSYSPREVAAAMGGQANRLRATEGSSERASRRPGKSRKTSDDARHIPGRVLVVRLECRAELPLPAVAPPLPVESRDLSLVQGPLTLAAGTHARVVLLKRLSAARNSPGDSFEARLVEPVHLGSGKVLPEGSIFRGHVVRRTPPRSLCRQGNLYLTFTSLTLPVGAEIPIAASLAGVEVDQTSRLTMDSEGGLRGGGRGTRAVLRELGLAAGISKFTDDSVQLLLELLISGATDTSTAGVARCVAAAASAMFLVTRHGRDAILPQYSEMDVAFTRPVLLSLPAEKTAVNGR
jgi:hypothetical protein